MSRATPQKLSFNAGELSVLMQGRTDYEKYPVSALQLKNFIATPQGPIIRRSGTYMNSPVYDDDKHSGLVPYIFSDEQAQMLEFADFRLRFHTEQGIVVYTPAIVTQVTTKAPFVIRSPALDAGIDDQVVLSGFPPEYNLEGVHAKVVNRAVNDYTLDTIYTGIAGPLAGATAARVYHIETPYPQGVVQDILGVQDVDLVYLFCPGYRPRKLKRKGAYDWQITEVIYEDGPFLSVDDNCPPLIPDDIGIATVAHTSAVSVTGTVSASTSFGGGFEAWRAFDRELKSYWSSNEKQRGWIQYEFVAPICIQGYTMYVARFAGDDGFSAKDYAPSTWTFEGYDEDLAQWIVLDERFDYTLFGNYRSLYIDTKNKKLYKKYKIDVTQNVNGASSWPHIGDLYFRKRGDIFINLASETINGINRDRGFLTTDVGRLIRLYQTDGFWRSAVITTVTNTTHITVKLQGEPLFSLNPIRQWRLGAFSDTTGWPTTATWFFDRLVLGGITDMPTGVAMSKPGDGFYDIFSPTDPNGTVNDDNGLFIQLKTRNQSLIRWMEADDKWLLISTASQEWAVGANTDNQVFGARNVRAKPSTRRGSAQAQPVRIDRQVLFIERMRRQIYEHAYRFEEDGYKSPSLSILAQHIGASGFNQIVYQSQPHSIVWVRRDEPKDAAAITYNREEKVVGWHTHDFAGGRIESMAVIPSPNDKQDQLWMVMRRSVGSRPRRFIERLMPYWDFDYTIEQAHFVDCGRKILLHGQETWRIYVGLFLEGKAVSGLADGIPFGQDRDVIVTNGYFDLPRAPASNYVTVGLPYVSLVETERLEAGGTGTSQGKIKRIHEVVVFVWDTYGGEIGATREQEGGIEWTDIPLPEDGGVETEVKLRTGMIGPWPPPTDYGKRGSLLLRQRLPLPMNIISILPRLETQDGG